MENKKMKISKLQNWMKKQQIDGFIIQDPINIFYFTNLNISPGEILITRDELFLFVGRRDEAMLKDISPIPVYLSEKREELFSNLIKEKKLLKIGFDSNCTLFSSYQKMMNFLKKIDSGNTSVSLVGFNNTLMKLRIIKEKEEINAMKKAAEIAWSGFCYIHSLLKEGITEAFLAMEFEIFCRKNGAQKLAFDPVIAFGCNSAYPHHQPGDTELKNNDVVLIDVGVVFNQYHSDLTRTVFFGSCSSLINNFYNMVKTAHSEALKLCRPGIHVCELYKCVTDYFSSKGYEKHFIHSLGHGVGLEIHESPIINNNNKEDILEPGMVITIEPGLYKENEGGVRYEDTIVITENGYENFYPDKEV
jgi:Xaa-Pro aminopeptidase